MKLYIQFEVGKRYLMRSGRPVTVTHIDADPSAEWPISAEDSTGRAYCLTRTGHYYSSNSVSEMDVVAAEHAPANACMDEACADGQCRSSMCEISVAQLESEFGKDSAAAALGRAQVSPKNAADILADMAKTYRERNAVYGSNYKMVAPLMAVLFPNGVPPDLVVTHQFHLFELILVKLSRFAISNLSHQDSIHDLSVYGAMIEAIILEQQKEQVA